MLETKDPKGMTAEKKLESALLFTKAQLKNEKDTLANLSNISAIINMYMDDINWVGFYLMKEGTLILGPFQGKPACNRIAVGEGVCGTAVQERKTQRVDDVLSLDNHIACDSASRSELVVPIYKEGVIFGVLDIDSPSLARFSDLEQTYMEKLVNLLENSL
ncbi:GAF domain-containing protein [Proteiniclasticum ruminis]|uniref:GAF domain-containing protein n=1 Tax=Proteiniclasticum ruminis TaxID=398199 RepID=A0A1I4XX96_9CLOT|nr:GAF domain-containing protein [Proteiniclasticum ruminis]SFN30454.1 GAF domain-containing protein [Proteiniclasticum ruminis]